MDWIDNPNYYIQDRPYKDKYICGDCRKCFKRKVASDIGKSMIEKPAKCPQCGNPTMWIGPKFEPPKTTDANSWRSIEIMRRIGFAGFFGFASDQVVIPKGINELKKYLLELRSKFDASIDAGGLAKEQLKFKTIMQKRIDKELKNISSS